MTIKLLKEKSKRNLEGNKKQLCFAFFVIELISSVILIMDIFKFGTPFFVILGIIVLLIICGLSYLNPGYYSMLLNISRNQKVKIGELFNKSFLFSKSLVLEIFNYIFKAFIYLPSLFIVIYVICQFLKKYYITFNGYTVYSALLDNVVVLGIVSVISLIIFLYLFLTYRMAYFFLLDNPSFSSIKCMRASRKMMKKNKIKLLRIYLSYIPSILIILVICVILSFLRDYIISNSQIVMLEVVIRKLYIVTIIIGFILFVPKLNVTIANFYDVLKGTYSDVKSKTINNNFNNVYFNDSATQTNVQNSGVLDNYNKYVSENKKETNEVFDIQKEGK